MKKAGLNPIKWLLVILFTSYVSGISFFTHTHVLDKQVFIHSHPFKKNEAKDHNHTENQLVLLEHFYKTSLTEDIIPETDLREYPRMLAELHVEIIEAKHLTNFPDNTRLRAPPCAA